MLTEHFAHVTKAKNTVGKGNRENTTQMQHPLAYTERCIWSKHRQPPVGKPTGACAQNSYFVTRSDEQVAASKMTIAQMNFSTEQAEQSLDKRYHAASAHTKDIP